MFDLIFSELSASDSAEPPDAPEPEVLMLDATDITAHPTVSSLNKGGCPPPDWWHQGGMTSTLHGVCDSKGRPLRLHLSEGQCSDFTGADGVRKDLPSAATVMGDQGYDRDKIRKMLSQQGLTPCIPPPVAAARNQSITARGCSASVTKSRRSFPNRRTGGPLQPTTTAAPTSSVLPSSWPPPSSSGNKA